MKVAIIGRGFGVYAMQPAFEARGWDVDVVPSRDEQAVSAACAGDADLVAVHSPPFQHREHVLKAIDAGKDVLCDKPFGRNAAEAREMRDAAKAAGLLHFLNFEFREQPAMVAAKAMLVEGKIGELQHISITSHANYIGGRPFGWLNDAEKGGGWIGAWGSHQIDALRWLAGSEIDSCETTTRIDAPERALEGGGTKTATAEDAFVATFNMENGITAMMDAAFAAPLNLPGITRLLGSAGAIDIENNAKVTLLCPDEEPQVLDRSEDWGKKVWPAIAGWIGRIEEAREKREQIAPNFDDGVAVAEVMDKMRT